MRNRKVINLILSIIMVTTLAGCSFPTAKNDKKEDGAATTATTEEAAKEVEPAADEAEPAAGDKAGQETTEEKVEGIGQIQIGTFEEEADEKEKGTDAPINSSADNIVPLNPQESSSNSEEPDSPLTKGCTSSEKAIFTYWDAMANCNKTGFEKCIIGEKTIDEQYENSIALKNAGFTIYYDQVTINSVSDYDISAYKAYGITDAKTASITVPIKKAHNGKNYLINDCYDIVTAQTDGVWFVIGLTETDVYIVREITEEDVSDPVSPVTPSNVKNNEYELSDSAKSLLEMTETDYNKVSWDHEYAPFQDNTVFSTTTYKGYSTDYLVIAITNLSNEPISVTAGGKILGANGGYVGDIFIYDNCIGPMNTCVETFYCNGTPSGSIEWTRLEKDAAPEYSEYIPWGADWTIQKNEVSGNIEFSYDMTFEKAVDSCSVTGVALDKAGKIIDVRDDYIHDTLSTNVKNTITIYSDYSAMGLSDFALFANPVKNNY